MRISVMILPWMARAMYTSPVVSGQPILIPTMVGPPGLFYIPTAITMPLFASSMQQAILYGQNTLVAVWRIMQEALPLMIKQTYILPVYFPVAQIPAA